MSVPRSPWHFLTALDGESLSDRALLRLTRQYELEVVSDMIAASRVSLLYSMSGNGKTSLVNAGIVPEFRERGYAVFRTRPRPPWCTDDPAKAFRISALREARLPLFTPAELQALAVARGQVAASAPLEGEEVASLLLRVHEKVERLVVADPDHDEFRRRMESHLTLPIARFVEEIRSFLDPDTRMLFICDQFEEMFVHFGNSARLRDFAEQIGEMHRDPSLKTHLLFSMREDWVGSMIEFRSELPDLFVNYFKLDPLHQSRGITVLSQPLETQGIQFHPKAAERIVTDLAAIYSLNVRARGAMQAVPSPENDPFIEAPALQIVAERLWETREETDAEPFSIAHYEWLTRTGRDEGEPSAEPRVKTVPAQDASPAQHVLNSYLDGLLNNLPDSSSALTELRIDCLYLLTDTVRHRRAVGRRALLHEVRALRPQGLDLPQVDEATLSAAVEPLKAKGLVREFSGADGTRQYELVHDFAVRTVVRRWRELERSRTEALAILRNDDQRRRTTLAQLLDAEKAGLYALRLLLLLAGGIVLVTSARVVWDVIEGGSLRWLAGAGVVLAVLSLPAALLALRESRSFSFALSCVLLLSGVAVQWKRPPEPSGALLITVILAAIVCVILTLRAVIELIPDPFRASSWSRAAKVLLAELVDGWPAFLLACGAALTLEAVTGGMVVIAGALTPVALWIGISALMLSRKGVTLGAQFAQFAIEHDGGGPPPFLWAVIRQFLVVAWTMGWIAIIISNSLIVVIVALVLTPLLSIVVILKSSRGGNVYDSAAQTRILHSAPNATRKPRLPWVLASIPAGVAAALFFHTEGARRAESDFATLSHDVREIGRAEREYHTVHGAFTSSFDSLRNVRGLGYYPLYRQGLVTAIEPVDIAVRVGYGSRGTECVALLSRFDQSRDSVTFCRRVRVAETITEDTTAVVTDTMSAPMVVPTSDTLMISTDTSATDTTPF